jgi:hypothetical protein
MNTHMARVVVVVVVGQVRVWVPQNLEEPKSLWQRQRQR